MVSFLTFILGTRHRWLGMFPSLGSFLNLLPITIRKQSILDSKLQGFLLGLEFGFISLVGFELEEGIVERELMKIIDEFDRIEWIGARRMGRRVGAGRRSR